LSSEFGDGVGNFLPDKARVRFQTEIGTGQDNPDLLFEKAGPRKHLFFDPAETKVGMVTCGGLCPGLNNVIRSATLELYHNYGVKQILGFRYGYQGLNPDEGRPPKLLDPDAVDNVHRWGGTILGSSRGAQDVGMMVDTLEREQVNILLCVGGDGTQHGTHEIAQEALRRGSDISVIGIPKTIDNDISYVRQTFGYFTAIEEARDVLECAHTEARGAPNGIGLVKVMGRDSGFIAAGATIASQEVNFCLVPEVPFELEGKGQFFDMLQQRIEQRRHALVVVAEGAGQQLMPKGDLGVDASGNRLHKDIGTFLRDRIKAHFKEIGLPVNLKYIDPSYTIRSVAANSQDCQLCDMYARSAVHAGMAGKTDLLVGFWNGSFIHVPIEMAIGNKRQIDPEGEMWESVIATTGQPRVWPPASRA
jgi:6-phosphofructokinase 1